MLDNFSEEIVFENTDTDNTNNLDSHILSFQIKHSRVCEWLIKNRNSNYFAHSLNDYLMKKGFLTIAQVKAVRKSISKEEKQRENRSRRIHSTQPI